MKRQWLRTGIVFFLTLILTKKVGGSQPPVTVYGHESMTCLEEKNMCIALGQAWAKRQDLLVSGDELRVHFKKVEGKRVITAFQAIGHVKVNHPSGVIVGDQLWYAVATQTLTVTGKSVMLKTQRYFLTANKKLEYCHQTNLAFAVGNAEFKQGESTIASDFIEAQFHPSTPSPLPAGKKEAPTEQQESLTLQWAKTKGHVRVWQNDQRASSDRAFYDALTQKVHLWGQVSLSQGKNFAKGKEGIVDLKNKKATLVGGQCPVYFLLNPQHLNHQSGKSP